MGSATIGGEHNTGLDFPGYAQEFLRRNPHYRSRYEQLMAGGPAPPDQQEVMARNWGLSFPMSA